jgi:hypothetical protein
MKDEEWRDMREEREREREREIRDCLPRSNDDGMKSQETFLLRFIYGLLAAAG